MEDTSKLCPFCREEIKADAIKCRYCGSMLSEGPIVGGGDASTTVRLALASKFEILEEVGKGGMATVFKAVQKNLGRTVALKILPPQFTHDNEFLERFHREAREAARLSHPNIVMVHDEGCEHGIHFISMEYLDGTNLHSRIQARERMSIDETTVILAPIAEALDYAHMQGIIHRDVKSANIIVTESGRSVLTDFGIAHAASGTKLTRTGTVIGTPEYMSPEQADGHGIDGRSDQYSLAVVAYECLAGRVPFRGDNPLTVLNKVLHDDPLDLSIFGLDLSSSVRESIHRALSKNPGQRFDKCRAFIEALEVNPGPKLSRWANDGKDQSAGHLETSRRVPNSILQEKAGRDRPALYILGALITIVLVILGVLLTRGSGSRQDGPASQPGPLEARTILTEGTPGKQQALGRDSERLTTRVREEKPEKTKDPVQDVGRKGQAKERARKSDYAIQTGFQRAYDALRQRIISTGSRGNFEALEREIQEIESEYKVERAFLDKALYPDTFSSSLNSLRSLLHSSAQVQRIEPVPEDAADKAQVVTIEENEPPPADFVAVEKEPVVVKKVEPRYPELAMRAGLEGKVWVKIWVGKDGKPKEIVILKSDAEIFNEPAIEAARQFVFTAAYLNNSPVSVWVSVPFKFYLADRKK